MDDPPKATALWSQPLSRRYHFKSQPHFDYLSGTVSYHLQFHHMLYNRVQDSTEIKEQNLGSGIPDLISSYIYNNTLLINTGTPILRVTSFLKIS